MYCEGKYIGAISYVVCQGKRYWGKEHLSQLSELTKLISAHLTKAQALNASHLGILSVPEFDPLTGLLSFSRFRDEVERIIVGNEHQTYIMVYSDLEDFKYINQKYGYSMGDQLLKEFSNYIIRCLKTEINVYFTRIVADQFALFMPYEESDNAAEQIHKINAEFLRRQQESFPEVTLRIRSGI
ncbi:MAG: diguanylate cyclase [Eubacteriales bacterium]|nr:diguanylate cyclase [Eubacteriales bacterium]